MTDGVALRVAPGTLGPGLAGLKAWRGECAAALADLRRWALVNRLCDDMAAARLAHLERRLAVERLEIAFVAGDARTRHELVNALFHCAAGTLLLPDSAARTTPCPTQILHDPSRPPCISVLPIETRESPHSLREFIAEPGDWTQIAIDPADPEGYARAFEGLSEAIGVSAASARSLGFPAQEDEHVEIPRWRYAIVNLPHPLLAMGLEIFLAPGVEALANEPDLALHRLPEADAIALLLPAETEVANPDLPLWGDYLRPLAQMAGNGYLILDAPGGPREAGMIAAALGIRPERVFPVSAGKALAARLEGDGSALAECGLVRLEQAIAQEVVHARRLDHALAIRAESRTLLAEARTLLDSRRQFAEEQTSKLGRLRRKSTLLLESLANRTADEGLRAQEAQTALAGLRAVHGRHGDTLAALLDPEAVREAGLRVHTRMLGSALSGGIGACVDDFLAECRTRLGQAIEGIDEVNAMIAAANGGFAQRWGLSPIDVAPFATDRFLLELDRILEQSRRDLSGPRSLLTRGRKSLAALFLDSVAIKTAHVFEIADREVRTWMNAFIRPLDAQVAALQEQAHHHLQDTTRMRDAQASLVDRIDRLDAVARECAMQHGEWEAHVDRLDRLLRAGPSDPAPPSSPAP